MNTQPPADPPAPTSNPAPAPQPADPRRRLRELLSIPERDRTEEQWDEIVELEIQLAPGNRIGGPSSAPTGKGGTAPAGGNAQPPRNKQHRAKPGGPRRPKAGGKPPRDPA